MSGKRLFIGNISYRTDEAALRAFFSDWGEITEINLPTDRETGRLLRFGFVQFRELEAAQKALAEANGLHLDGVALDVKTAKQRPSRYADPRAMVRR